MVENSLKIRNLELKNRLVMPPMATSKAADGIMKDDLIEYYVQRANDFGMIITEHAYVTPCGIAHPNQLGMLQENQDEFLKLAKKIHEKGCGIIAQISHAGCRAAVENPQGPSDFDFSGKKDHVQSMTKEDIEEVKDAFVRAAKLAKDSGFDGVEVHIAHGYLLNQFYSPVSNHREDEYGGKVENRIRFACEVVEAIRENCSDLIISVRLGMIDDCMNGNTVEDAVEAAKLLERAGADLISLSGGLSGFVRKEYEGPAYFAKESKSIKEAVTIPVLLTGGITTKTQCEELLNGNYCDLIGIGRPLLKDPDYIGKILKGE